MPNVNDLVNFFTERQPHDASRIRTVRRMLQEADLLPRGTRGTWRNMPEATVEHAAWFLLGLASTNNPKQAAVTAQLFAGLKNSDEGPTVLDRIVGLINHYQSGAQVTADWHLYRMIFEHSQVWPAVEETTLIMPGAEDEHEAVNRFAPSDDDADFDKEAPDQIQGASIVPGEVFRAIADLYWQHAEAESGSETVV